MDKTEVRIDEPDLCFSIICCSLRGMRMAQVKNSKTVVAKLFFYDTDYEDCVSFMYIIYIHRQQDSNTPPFPDHLRTHTAAQTNFILFVLLQYLHMGTEI